MRKGIGRIALEAALELDRQRRGLEHDQGLIDLLEDHRRALIADKDGIEHGPIVLGAHLYAMRRAGEDREAYSQALYAELIAAGA